MNNTLKTLIGCVIAIVFIASISSCEKSGCTNPAASNYNSSATKNDGSCIIPGCMDPTATNYNSAATIDNGSCVYGGGTTGRVVFWYNSSGTVANVSINGLSGQVTQYYASSTPTCGSAGCATFSLPVGNYAYSAASSFTSWQGTVAITSGGCVTVLLQ